MGYPYGNWMGYPGIQQMGSQAPQFGQMQPAQQPQSSGPDWIMAPSIKQVEQVGVQPGQKAWIMVQNEPVFALRTADQMGLVTTAYYRFEKIDPNATETSPSQEYITRQEFDAFVSSLRGDQKEGKK